jgi:hypothetical protein
VAPDRDFTITFGFSIQQFFRTFRAGAPLSDRLIGPQEFGLIMIIVDLLALAIAVLQSRADLRDLRERYPREHGYPLTYRSRARYLAGLFALLRILGLLSMIVRN